MQSLGEKPMIKHSLALCRSDPQEMRGLLFAANWQFIRKTVAVMLVGGCCYGFSLGLWRSPMMGVYVAAKLPILLILVTLFNGALNGVIAQILGTGLSFRQTIHCVCISFAIFAAILGSLSPLFLFQGLSLPGPNDANASQTHSYYLLQHTAIIAVAGVIANVRLLGLLRNVAASRRSANLTFIAWCAGNLFVGAQLSWVLRPFFGSPNLDVAFLRPDPMNGTFYESVGRSVSLLIGKLHYSLPFLGFTLFLFLSILYVLRQQRKFPDTFELTNKTPPLDHHDHT
jgi:hypothetical protein